MKLDSFKTKVAGEWKDSLLDHTKVDGIWKTVNAVWTKIAGEWVNDLRDITFNVQSIKKREFVFRPRIGDFVYGDKTWSTQLNADKTCVGVITDVRSRDFDFMALDFITDVWGSTGYPISGIISTQDAVYASTDYAGKSNTDKIHTQTPYPHANAVDHCKTYSIPNSDNFIRGTWYLPAAGQMLMMCYNSDVLSRSLSKVGGQTFPNTDGIGYYTSTVCGTTDTWAGGLISKSIFKSSKGNSYRICPFNTYEYNPVPNGVYIYDSEGDRYASEDEYYKNAYNDTSATALRIVNKVYPLISARKTMPGGITKYTVSRKDSSPLLIAQINQISVKNFTVAQLNNTVTFTEEITAELGTSLRISIDNIALPMGIGVVTDEAQFVIHPVKNNANFWSNSTNLIGNITTTTDNTIALKDFKGRWNSSVINKHISNVALNTTFSNGQKGYAGALGEYWVMQLNREEINNKIARIGGNVVINDSMWSNTQRDNNTGWLSFLSPSNNNYADKNSVSREYVVLTELPFKEEFKSGVYVYADDYNLYTKEEWESKWKNKWINLLDAIAPARSRAADPGSSYLYIYVPLSYDVSNIKSVIIKSMGSYLIEFTSVATLDLLEYKQISTDASKPSTCTMVNDRNYIDLTTTCDNEGDSEGSVDLYLIPKGFTFDSVGVAVVEPDCQFVITAANTNVIYPWGNQVVLSGVGNASTAAIASLEFNGINNTKNIVANNGSGVAAAACVKHIFPNGQTGYLGSCGEWVTAYKNRIQVNECISLLRGAAIVANSHWTSTQNSTNNAWLHSWNNNPATNVVPISSGRGSNLAVTPFTEILEKVHEKQVTLNINDKIIVADSPIIAKGRIQHKYYWEATKDTQIANGNTDRISDDLTVDILLKAPAQVIFDTSISDPKNITVIDKDLAMDRIFAKNGRVLFKRTGDKKGTYIYLNAFDTTKFKDDTIASLSGSQGEVMAVLPELWYKYEKLEGTKFCYWISDTVKDSTWVHVEQSLVGAYKAYSVSGKLHSYSNITPNTGNPYTALVGAALANGAGYQLIDPQQHGMIALLLYTKYRNRNLQAVLGTGGAGTIPITATGSTNNYGNRDSINLTSKYVTGLGIEGVFGGVYEYVQGVSVLDLVWTITDPDRTQRIINGVASGGWITGEAFERGPYFDMVPTGTNGGSETTYYSDYFSISTGGPFCLLRSSDGMNTAGGVACASVSASESATNPNYGSRLAFRGIMTEEKDVTKFKELPLI